jgi:hypothetical protein
MKEVRSACCAPWLHVMVVVSTSADNETADREKYFRFGAGYPYLPLVWACSRLGKTAGFWIKVLRSQVVADFIKYRVIIL